MPSSYQPSRPNTRTAIFRLGLSLCWLLAILVLPRPATAREIIHIVGRGHTLSHIAQRYHTTVEAIRKHNRLAPGKVLQPGQRLRIVEVPAHAAFIKHLQSLQRGSGTAAAGSAKSSAQSAPEAKAKAKPQPSAGAPKQAAGKRRPPARRTQPAARNETGRRPADKDAGQTATAKRSTVAGRSGSAQDGPTAPDAGEPPSYEKYLRKPWRAGWVRLARRNERWQGQLVDGEGRVSPTAAQHVDRLLRSLRKKKERPIDHRLVQLLSEVSDAFGGRTIVLISGYRPYSSTQFTRSSQHNHARAADFYVVGVPNLALRDFLIAKLSNVGVGYYPNSYFVHLDVRDHKASWIDLSKPGKQPRYVRRPQHSDQQPVAHQAGSGSQDSAQDKSKKSGAKRKSRAKKPRPTARAKRRLRDQG